MGWPTGGTVDGTGTEANVLADTMIQNNIVTGPSINQIGATTPSNPAVINLLSSPAAGNRGAISGNSYVKLNSPYTLNNPNLRPRSTSPALTGADFNHVGITNFFTPTYYVGALCLNSNEDWSQEAWVNWTPTNTDYSNLPCNCAAGLKENTETTPKESVAADFAITPNPVTGNSFTVSNFQNLNGSISISVADFTGNVVYSSKQSVTKGTSLKINISNPQQGLHFVTITDGKQTVTKK